MGDFPAQRRGQGRRGGRALRGGNAEGRGGGRTALGETEEEKEGERRKKEGKERWLSADPGGSR